MKMIILLIKIALAAGLLFGLYVLGAILFATLTDYKPPVTEAVVWEGKTDPTAKFDSVITIYNWNIGYCGLGKESDFFYDGGKMVRPRKTMVDKNFAGVESTIKGWDGADFIFIQEMDVNSHRSYGLEQYKLMGEAMKDYGHSLALNYKVKFVPIPFTEPMGKVESGIVTYSKVKPTENTRHQFPSKFPWPKNLFMLDRCMLLQRYPLANGKELVAINQHLSAYDNTGELKAAEMKYLKDVLLAEYKKGNYVVVGGDWNQCPPDFDPYTKMTKEQADYDQSNIPKDFMPADWTYAFDKEVSTNRKVKYAYDPVKTYTTIIDFYLLSPNVEVIKVQGIDNGFEFSDHQPVMLQFKLKD